MTCPSPVRRRLAFFAVAASTIGVAALCLSGADDTAPSSAARSEVRTPAEPGDRLLRSGPGTARDDATPALGCYGAPAGSRFHHRVTDRADYRITGDQVGSQPAGDLHSECTLVTTVLARRDDEVLVEYRCDELQFLAADGCVIQDPVQAAFAAAAANPVLARVDGRGRVLGYGFADGLDGDQRNFLRGMLALVAFAAPATDAVAWTADEADTTGDYEARYELLPETAKGEVAVRRTKLRYRTIACHAELPAHELRGVGEARFPAQLGWLGDARLDESLTMALPLLELQMQTTRRAVATLLATEHVDVPAADTAAWQAAMAAVSGRLEVVGRFAEDIERRRQQQLLRGVTLEQLLAELLALAGQTPADNEKINDAFQRLQWLAKLDDNVSREVGERIATGQLEGELAGIALSSLGAAGTAAAQSVLVSVRSDRSLAADVRSAATIATLQLAAPTAELVQGLAADAAADFDGRSGALLVLGALAPRAKQPLADGRSPVAALLAMEWESAARGDVATWLLAVGNAAPAQTLSLAQRYLTHADAAVRAAACVALRRVADTTVVTLLVEHGLADRDPMVRREAMLVLARRSEPAARSALQQMAANDPDLDLRQRADQLLRSGA